MNIEKKIVKIFHIQAAPPPDLPRVSALLQVHDSREGRRSTRARGTAR